MYLHEQFQKVIPNIICMYIIRINNIENNNFDSERMNISN